MIPICTWVWERLVCSGYHNKVPQTRLLNWQKLIFLTVLDARSPRARCWQGWLLLSPLSLACTWLPSCCFPMVFCLCPNFVLGGYQLYWIRDQPDDFALTICLNYHFKGPISKYSQILRYLGLEFQHVNLGRGHSSAHNRNHWTSAALLKLECAYKSPKDLSIILMPNSVSLDGAWDSVVLSNSRWCQCC